jgi:hypothetical protein
MATPIAMSQGLGQQTPATQYLVAKASGARGGRTTQRRRRASGKKKAARAASAGHKRKRRTSRAGKLVKGSPASKARMAAVRKMRKR